MYNVSLAIYYWLVIVKRWKESRLRKAMIYFHATPVIVTIAFAFGGLPLYDWLPFVCHMQLFPIDDHLVEILVFILIPILVTVAILTLTLLNIFFHVRRTEQKAQRYLYGDKVSLQRRVFWQSFSYLLAFYIAWPSILAGTLLGGIRGSASFGYSIILLFVIPLQGMSNAIVFFRHRINNYVQTKWAERKSSGVIENELLGSSAFFSPNSNEAGASSIAAQNPDGPPASSEEHAEDDENASLPRLAQPQTAAHIPEEFFSPLQGGSDGSGNNSGVPMSIEVGNASLDNIGNNGSSPNNMLSMESSIGTNLGESMIVGDMDRSDHVSAISRVSRVSRVTTSKKNGSVLVHIPMQTADDPDDDVSLVISMLELNRHESQESMSFMIPTAALNRNRSGDYWPMQSFSHNPKIVAADPSIAIALDEEEVAEIFVPASTMPMTELKIGSSLDSSAISRRMRRSGDLASTVKRSDFSRNHDSLIDDNSGDEEENAKFSSIFQGLGRGGGGAGKAFLNRLSVIQSVDSHSGSSDDIAFGDDEDENPRPQRIVSRRRSTTFDALKRGLSVKAPSFFKNFNKGAERE